MNKKVTIASLVVIGFIFIVLVLLFTFRQSVATLALGEVLAETPITLEQLQGLDFTWNSARLGELALRTDGFEEPIRLHDIKVRFSPLDGHIKSVVVDRISIPAYAAEAEPAEVDAQPLVFSNLIRTLRDLPLQTLRVHKISLEQRIVTEQLQWQRQNRGQRLDFRHREFLFALALDTGADPGGVLHLSEAGVDLLALRFGFKKEGEKYRASATIEVIEENWTQTLASLKQQFPALARVTGARGKLGLSLHTDIPDNLDHALQHGLEMTITPNVDMVLGYALENLPMPSVESRIEINRPLSLNTDKLGIGVDMPALTASITAPNDQVVSTLQLEDIHCNRKQSLECTMHTGVSFTTSSLALDGLKMESVSGAGEGLLTINGQKINATLEMEQPLRAENIQQGNVAIQALTLRTPSPLQLSFDTTTEALSLSTDSLKMNLTDVAVAGNTVGTELAFSDLRLRQTDQLAFEAGVSATPITIEIPEQPLPRFGFQGDIALRDHNLAIEGTLNSDAARPLIAVKASHHLITQKGNANLQSTALVFDQSGNKLSSYFATWPLQLDLINGSWNINSQLRWRQAGDNIDLEGQFSQTLERLAGYYKDYAFTDLSSTLTTQIGAVDRLVSSQPAQATVGLMDIGLPVTDLSVRFSFDTRVPRIDLHRFQADLMGGRISATDITHQPAKADTTATLAIDDIDLGELVRLTASEDISATGRVSGQLPFVINATGLHMQQGQLEALKPGGVLAYHPDAATLQSIAANPTTKFAYDVLSNYHYSTLDTEIQYRPDGWMVLTNRMYGINPDLNSGQPIKLNPKIEVNALDTLRSLRISRTVSDFFENQLGNP